MANQRTPHNQLFQNVGGAGQNFLQAIYSGSYPPTTQSKRVMAFQSAPRPGVAQQLDMAGGNQTQNADSESRRVKRKQKKRNVANQGGPADGNFIPEMGAHVAFGVSGPRDGSNARASHGTYQGGPADGNFYPDMATHVALGVSGTMDGSNARASHEYGSHQPGYSSGGGEG